MQGSLTSFFLAEFINRSYLKFRNFQNLRESGYSVNLKKQFSEDLSKISDIIIIVPSEREAESLKINFSTICEDITVNIQKIPLNLSAKVCIIPPLFLLKI